MVRKRIGNILIGASVVGTVLGCGYDTAALPLESGEPVIEGTVTTEDGTTIDRTSQNVIINKRGNQYHRTRVRLGINPPEGRGYGAVFFDVNGDGKITKMDVNGRGRYGVPEFTVREIMDGTIQEYQFDGRGLKLTKITPNGDREEVGSRKEDIRHYESVLNTKFQQFERVYREIKSRRHQ